MNFTPSLVAHVSAIYEEFSNFLSADERKCLEKVALKLCVHWLRIGTSALCFCNMGIVLQISILQSKAGCLRKVLN